MPVSAKTKKSTFSREPKRNSGADSLNLALDALWTQDDALEARLPKDWFINVGFREGRDIYDVYPDDRGEPVIELHFHQGQTEAWESLKSIVAVIAGTQGGKTTFGPLWLLREILNRSGGDYLVAGPSFPLLSKKTIPEFRRLFEKHLKLGTYLKADAQFVFHDAVCEKLGIDPTTVFFGHAQNPDSLESATARAAWLDEAGQNAFRMGSFEAIQRRLLRYEGRMLITTTPYNLGWLYKLVWLPWKKAQDKRKEHEDIDVVRFATSMNPTISARVIGRAKRKMQPWKFLLMYEAIFVRPAGAIFETFERGVSTCKRFRIPAHWPRVVGVDFGPINTAATFWARSPEGVWYVYAMYHSGKKPVSSHVRIWRTKGLLGATQIQATGGAPSEDAYRSRYGAAGFPISKPRTGDVETGIDALHGLFTDMRCKVFDDLELLIDDIQGYSREVDASGEVTEKIENKSMFHRVDTCRYAALLVDQVDDDPDEFDEADIDEIDDEEEFEEYEDDEAA